MPKTIEAVPNFSEGRNKDKIESIVQVFRDRPGVKLVNYEPDADYNRTVVTLLGDMEAIEDALDDFVGIVLQEIDLNVHRGEHPRMGAVDVIPYIPIEGVSMSECVEGAKRLGARISQHYDVPVFLYAEAATSEERNSLPAIRKGEFEGMKEKIKDPKWAPDFGKSEIHPTFGAVAVGARPFLIAYNIDLDTKDEKIANQLAKVIRKSSGGFQHIQAGPAFLDKRGHVQVTMNILDYKKNPLYRIFETVKMESLRYHVEVSSAEIVGMIPKDALIQSLEYYFQVENQVVQPKTFDLDDLVEASRKYLLLRDFDKDKIIEFFL